MGWKPIETAPKDGTRVVLLTNGGRAFVAYFGEAVEDDEGRECWAWAADEEGQHPPCWTGGLMWALNEDEVPSDPPTHWMPLPAAPAVADTDKTVGSAEQDVGRQVYLRLVKLMDAKEGTTEAAELDYLAHLVESVEECGPDEDFTPLHTVTTPTAESKLREAVEKARDQFQMLEKLARAGRVKLAGKPYPKWDAVALEAAAGEDAMKSALRDAEGGEQKTGRDAT